MEAIPPKITQQNANILAESVLLHTLAYLEIADGCILMSKHTNVIDGIISYVDNNYTDPDITLKKNGRYFWIYGKVFFLSF